MTGIFSRMTIVFCALMLCAAPAYAQDEGSNGDEPPGEQCLSANAYKTLKKQFKKASKEAKKADKQANKTAVKAQKVSTRLDKTVNKRDQKIGRFEDRIISNTQRCDQQVGAANAQYIKMLGELDDLGFAIAGCFFGRQEKRNILDDIFGGGESENTSKNGCLSLKQQFDKITNKVAKLEAKKKKIEERCDAQDDRLRQQRDRVAESFKTKIERFEGQASEAETEALKYKADADEKAAKANKLEDEFNAACKESKK